MFAFSTVENMGIILVAVGLGTPASRYAALYQALCHSLTKSFCFLAAGATLLTTGSTRIASVRSLVRTSPLAAASLLIGGLAIGGAPPFALFLSECSIFRAGLDQGQFLLTALLMLFIVIGFAGITFRINLVLFGRAQNGNAQPVRLSRPCVSALLAAGLLVLWFGLYLPPFVQTLLRLGAGVLDR